MLFDLQGKRRRVVQATYLILAILMGGGLVLFGVGSGDISGGLFDAITGKDSNSSSSSNSAVNNRIKKDLAALKVNPQNQTALADLVRSHYQLATEDADPNTGAFGTDGKNELAKADTYWKRYVKVSAKPNDSLASLMLQAYSDQALNKPSDAAGAAELQGRSGRPEGSGAGPEGPEEVRQETGGDRQDAGAGHQPKRRFAVRQQQRITHLGPAFATFPGLPAGWIGPY
jgi:hypothetical protein